MARHWQTDHHVTYWRFLSGFIFRLLLSAQFVPILPKSWNSFPWFYPNTVWLRELFRYSSLLLSLLKFRLQIVLIVQLIFLLSSRRELWYSHLSPTPMRLRWLLLCQFAFQAIVVCRGLWLAELQSRQAGALRIPVKYPTLLSPFCRVGAINQVLRF